MAKFITDFDARLDCNCMKRGTVDFGLLAIQNLNNASNGTFGPLLLSQ